MIDEVAKQYLHDDLRWIREAMVRKLYGLSEYDIHRPLTSSGTNLLGCSSIRRPGRPGTSVSFLAGRPRTLPRWGRQHRAQGVDLWATEEEPREAIIDFYRRVWEHLDATISALNIHAMRALRTYSHDPMRAGFLSSSAR